MLSLQRHHGLVVALSVVTALTASFAASGCSSAQRESDVATSDANLTAAETGAIEAANTLSLEDLTEKVGLSRMIALSIVGTREGADGRTGTSDDVRFETMDDLRRVPLFNGEAEAQLLAYGAMLQQSEAAPWRKGLPKGQVSLRFGGVTMLRNDGVTAYLSEVPARITCLLTGQNPGEILIRCEVPRNVWGCGFTSGLATCDVYSLEGGEHGDFPEAEGVVDSDGYFEAEGIYKPMEPGKVNIGGALLVENDKITGLQVGSFSMHQTCNSKYCKGRTIHDLSPFDPSFVLPVADPNRLVTNLDFLACHLEGRCVGELDPDPQAFAYSRNFLPNESLRDSLGKRPMDPLRASDITADWFCRETWEFTGRQPKARMANGDRWGQFSCNVKP
jgi:hypothetical protein